MSSSIVVAIPPTILPSANFSSMTSTMVYSFSNVFNEVNMNNNRITNLSNPIDNHDAVNKQYADSIIGGGNLTGPISATAGVTNITSQSGTGTTFVMKDYPLLISPSITGNITIDGKIISNDTTNATSLLTGSFCTPGGISVSKDVRIGGTCYANEFFSTSDKRLKNRIKPIEKPIIDKFLQIKGYQYYMNNDLNLKYGIIAQELEDLGLNDLVDNTDKYKKVSYNSLIPLIIESVRNTNDRIDNLEKIIESLSCKLNIVEKVTINNFKRVETNRLKKRRSQK
jgi:hypothetical protein